MFVIVCCCCPLLVLSLFFLLLSSPLSSLSLPSSLFSGETHPACGAECAGTPSGDWQAIPGADPSRRRAVQGCGCAGQATDLAGQVRLGVYNILLTFHSHVVSYPWLAPTCFLLTFDERRKWNCLESCSVDVPVKRQIWQDKWDWEFVIIIIMMMIALKGTVWDFFYNLLTVPRTVCNVFAEVVRVHLCANHMEHMEHLSRAACHMLQGTMDRSVIKFDRIEIAFIFALCCWLKWLTNERGEKARAPGENPCWQASEVLKPEPSSSIQR